MRPRRVAIGGVCLGVANHLGWSVGRTRALAIVLSLFGGAGVLLYLWLWALTPLEPPRTGPAVPGEPDDRSAVIRWVPAASILLAFSTVAAIVAIVIEPHLPDDANGGIIATIVFAAAAVAWSLGFDRTDPRRTARGGVIIRSSSAAVLIVSGALLLLSSDGRPRAVTAVGAIVLLLFGLAVVVAPTVVRLWVDLMGERAARVREVQRAEIAAHLHDSVLQTLALIQTRAGASSEVARLARAQERELRDWLFAGSTPSGSDLATALRSAATAIELDYPARIEVVVVGDPPEHANAALVAAAREAMVNAARHAGGEISVYLEVSASTIDLFVRDRGAGFDLEALPADRIGVRESIIGRMIRAGGTAMVSRATDGVGTEVHLRLENGHG